MQDLTESFKRGMELTLRPYTSIIKEATPLRVGDGTVVFYPCEVVFSVQELDTLDVKSPIVAFVRGHSADLGSLKCDGGFLTRTAIEREIIVRVPDGTTMLDENGRTIHPKRLADMIYGRIALLINVKSAVLATFGIYHPFVDAVCTEIPAEKEALVRGDFGAELHAGYKVEQTYLTYPS
jgi:hypothetical protein